MGGTDREARFIENWSRVRSRLRAEVGEAAYRSWLKPLTLAGCRGGSVRLHVPSRFMRDWVQSNYADRIRLLWVEEDEKVSRVDIVVQVANRPTTKRPGQDGDARVGNGAGGAVAPFDAGDAVGGDVDHFDDEACVGRRGRAVGDSAAHAPLQVIRRTVLSISQSLTGGDALLTRAARGAFVCMLTPIDTRHRADAENKQHGSHRTHLQRAEWPMIHGDSGSELRLRALAFRILVVLGLRAPFPLPLTEALLQLAGELDAISTPGTEHLDVLRTVLLQDDPDLPHEVRLTMFR